jgi:DsrE/DsrF/DsrH-like protein
MSSTRTAIVVLSDPRAGEEALGRLFNALAATYDFKQKQQDVQLIFQGTGTRWTGLLTKADRPAHALYKAVEDKIAGVSAGCAVVFGATEDAEQNGFSLITTNQVPGTPGLPSLAAYAADGYSILTF